MARYDYNWKMCKLFCIVVIIFSVTVAFTAAATVTDNNNNNNNNNNDNNNNNNDDIITNLEAGPENNGQLTACQHLRHAETRRAKSLSISSHQVRIPKCSKLGEFEPIQCSNELNGTECWCVDQYGVEIIGTRKDNKLNVKCDIEPLCPASSCRMYCPSGFARDGRSGCPICQCRDPCAGVICPGGLACQAIEVNCTTDPCPPVPTCKKARSLNDLCPAGQPLTISDTVRPFLCGHEPGKPNCPPLYKCLVQSGNDYGVCCPASIKFQKPGDCPRPDDVQSSAATGVLCGTPCSSDLECPQMDKCCHSNGCGTNCKQPFNVTMCHQARMLSEILSVNEREGRGYVPQCDDLAGGFAGKQCSRNGLVCWCVDPLTGNKIKGTMGAGNMVNCNGILAKTKIVRSQSRSVDAAATMMRCDQNICASVCEYGFKSDHNGCPTCECSEPCEGFRCPMGSHCEVAKDPECRSGSSLCASEPVCKPDLVYTNPCDIGTPLASNKTGEIFYCHQDLTEMEEYQSRSFYDSDDTDSTSSSSSSSSRSMTNFIECPNYYQCTKLPKVSDGVCCPKPEPDSEPEVPEERPQSMCEYLRDFSDRMEGTEAGMTLALPSPTCASDGGYEPIICRKKIIKVTKTEQRKILEEKNVRQMKALLQSRKMSKRSAASPTDDDAKINNDELEILKELANCPVLRCRGCEFGFKYDQNGCMTCECLDKPLPNQEDRQCPLYKCKPCENGYKFNEIGCRTCDCLPDSSVAVTRTQRNAEPVAENLRLVKVATEDTQMHTDQSSGRTAPNVDELDVKSIIKYLRQNILARSENSEANYMAEILSRKLMNQVVQEQRNAKVIDTNNFGAQSLDYGSGKKPMDKTRPMPESKINPMAEVFVEIEIDECYCIDGFGTEIPGSRGTNVTLNDCSELRESLECLDITCRMGCDYGFILDPETKCPLCECRDPCDSVVCSDGQECRSVEVSCEGEYCPPVPACLPRKPGQCPFLVPPGTEGSTIDSCEYECRSDSHCIGAKRCCSNGCGTQCVEPQLKTACQHLQTIQLHQATELGMPARQKYIAQCNETDGSWNRVQCGPGNICWCVDIGGNELSGTRITNGQPNCDQIMSRNACPDIDGSCKSCEFGYLVDAGGCRTCECRNPCNEISCPGGEQCQLMKVECIDEPCPKMPICIPLRESVCSEGLPFKRNGQDLICGPQGDAELCPSTHTCQLDVASNKGVCCAKTRDVCFESVDSICFAANGGNNDQQQNQTETYLKWRFSPKQNKCVQMPADKSCQSKNLFHSENACESVCPVLSQCERLRLRNSLAAKRVQSQSLAWFQPRCDPETGSWSPVQCLGKSSASASSEMELNSNKVPASSRNGVSRAFSVNEPKQQNSAVGVCWCADKKGAPVKGTLTRDIEPICNYRQARNRMSLQSTDFSVAGVSTADDADTLRDPMIEQLINQITLISDEDNFIETDYAEEHFVSPQSINKYTITQSAVTERILEIANSIFDDNNNNNNQFDNKQQSTTKLIATSTRCNALKSTASFSVACDKTGAFEPTQCNDAVCWCVDAAGNQLPQTSTFTIGSTKCYFTPIEAVSVELHFPNLKRKTYKNLYDILRFELKELLGDVPDNLRVHENSEGNIYLKFDLTDSNKIDTAFALEEMAKQNNLILANGELKPDITMSRFIHKSSTGGYYPIPQPAAHLMPESAFQMIIFVLATTSAFLISIFVVFIMLKRGKNKMKSYNTNKTVGMGDKFLDYSSPIFVLSANEKEKTNSLPNSNNSNSNFVETATSSISAPH